MKEILGYNLEKFFRRIEYPCDGGVFERTYKGTDYEVWAMTDNIFDIICDYSEDEFVELQNLFFLITLPYIASLL